MNASSTFRLARADVISEEAQREYCSYVQLLEFSDRCEFVKNTESCQEDVFFFSFLEIIYCSLKVNNNIALWASTGVLLIFCLYCFMILGLAANDYFCPALTVMSHILGLSEQLAGVTLLAFGNGAPDVFTGITGLGSPTRTLISDISTGVTFVLFAVGGAVIIAKPFVLNGDNFLRDSGFLAVDFCVLIFILSADGYVGIFGSVLYLSIYFLYIFIVLLMHYLATRTIRHIEKQKIRLSLIELEIANREAAVNPMKSILQRPTMLEHQRRVSEHVRRRFRAVARAALAYSRDSTGKMLLHKKISPDHTGTPSTAASTESMLISSQQNLAVINEQPSRVETPSTEQVTDIETRVPQSERLVVDITRSDGLIPPNETETEQTPPDVTREPSTEQISPNETGTSPSDQAPAQILRQPSTRQLSTENRRSISRHDHDERLTSPSMTTMQSTDSSLADTNGPQRGAKKFAIDTAALMLLSNQLGAQAKEDELRPCLTLDCLKKKNSVSRETITLWQQFWRSVNPIDENFKENSRISRIFRILVVPFDILLRLIVPVVDYEKPLLGWSKLLNCIQIVTLPLFFFCFAFPDKINETINGMPIIVCIFIVAVALASILFGMTKVNKMPPRFEYFCILGVFGSIFVIYLCALMIINLLSVIGITSNRSNSFLGSTLLAWGNGIGDLVTNVSMARRGYQRMAFAACFGGPLFNSLISIGLSLVYKTIQADDHRYQPSMGLMAPNCFALILIGLLALTLAALLTNFVFRRSFGFFLIIIYIIFMMMALLSEFDVIHPYGTDHKYDFKPSRG